MKSGQGSLIQLIDGPDGPKLGTFDDPMEFCAAVFKYTLSQERNPRRRALKRLADETRRQAHLQANDAIGSHEIAKYGPRDFQRIVKSCFAIANWGERSRKATEGKIRYTKFRFWRDAIEYVIAACDELRDEKLPCEKFRIAQQEVGARTPYLFLHPLEPVR